MSEHSIAMSEGLPSTVLPELDPALRQRLAAALAEPPATRRDSVAAVVADNPRVLVDELSVSGEDQQGRQVRRHDVNPARPEVTEIELVEVAGIRQCFEPDSQRELGCMVFGQVQTCR